jgi:hypothetical protein
MFTIEQKKLIIELQTSKKHVGGLIGPHDSQNHLNRCCLGVYAHCCGYEKDSGGYIEFKDCHSVSFFYDYSLHNLSSISGDFWFFGVYEKNESCAILNLSGLNDCTLKDFSHEFISKFLFTMPERVFTNFRDRESLELRYDIEKFISEIERLAEEKNYVETVEGWKKELS